MLIYDRTICAFIRKSEIILKEILSELHIEVRRSRFFYGKYLYPINIVVFEGKELGHFDSSYLQIGLNKKLVYLAKDSVLRDILKHELAHYLTFAEFGNVNTHGPEFKMVCEKFGFSREIAAATMNMEEANLEKVGDLDAEKVLEKVKKLLQLAQSSNAHESELATMKANSLLLRHNLDRLKGDDEPIYVERVLKQTRVTPKLMAIQHIMKHFIVKCVLSTGKGKACLSVSGSLTNVKLAEYVSEFLDREFDHLWELEKKESGLSGLRAKNSFFWGISRGYDQKMEQARRGLTPEDQKSLVLVNADLEEKSQMIYGRLSNTTSSASLDAEATGRGMQRGLGLTIRQGVESSSKGLYLPS